MMRGHQVGIEIGADLLVAEGDVVGLLAHYRLAY